MITTFEEYRKNYLDLLDSQGNIPSESMKMVNPKTEEKFKIDANTRIITVPEQFKKGVAVYKDYKSETLFFEVDRYFDDVDLLSKKCVIQIENAEGIRTALPANYKYLSEDNLKVIIGWTLTQEVTAKAGEITFSIRFFSLDDKGVSLDYNWQTIPCKIQIYSGLYVTEDVATIPSKTTLELLLDQITSLWANGQPTYRYDQLIGLPTINGALLVGDVAEMILTLVSGSDSSGKFLKLSDVLQVLDKTSKNPVGSNVLWTKFENQDLSLSELDSEIERLKEEMSGMSYVPIEILDFKLTPPTAGAVASNKALVENGQRLSNIRVTWKMSKDPTGLSIKYGEISTPLTAAATGSTDINLAPPITENTTFTLVPTEKKGTPNQKTAELVFCNNIYYGARVLKNNNEIDLNFIKDSLMKRVLSDTKNISFNINIPNDRYLYIAIPKSLGAPFQFSVDGSLKGGFDFIKDMILTCANEYTTEYSVYRTTNPSLGNVTITVS